MNDLAGLFDFAAASRAALTSLGLAALSGLALVALVAAICRLLPILPAGIRSLLWWGVCLKMVLSLTGVGFEVPVLPSANLPTEAAGFEPLLHPPSLRELAVDESAGVAVALSSLGARVRAFSWWEALALAWLAGVGVGLVKTAVELVRLHGVRIRAAEVEDGWLLAELSRLAALLDLRRVPALRLSTEVSVPQLVGFVRPEILLPEVNLERLRPAELSMLLAHELGHLSRRDLWWGWVPWLAECLFFFHPAVKLAVREYNLAREAACDVLALELLGSAPQEYGRMLLRWGVATRETGLAAAAASPSAKTLKRRLEMLGNFQRHGIRRSNRAWWGAAALALLLPWQLVSAGSRAEAEPGEGRRDNVSSRQRGSNSGWAYIEEQHEHGLRMTADGNFDWRTVKRLASEQSLPVLLVEREGNFFEIKDPALLERVREMLRPMNELGEEQGRLGELQGQLGEKQGKLGERQGELGEAQGLIGEKMGEIGERLGELGEELAELVEDGFNRDSEAESNRRRELEREMEKFEDEMDALAAKHASEMRDLGGQHEELARLQEALGRQQEELGRQQEELGRRHEALAKQVERKIDDLVEQARAAGKAERVK